MPFFDNLMKRLGFVKLVDFGLVLTPEGRVISKRPAALDDGLGGRIVGWRDGDLAAMELDKWEPARPSVKLAVARGAAPPARLAAVHPVVAAPVVAAPVVAAPVVAAAPIVAPAPVVEEDDWEWTIAIARSRAAAEEVEQAAAPVTRGSQRRMRANTAPLPDPTEGSTVRLPTQDLVEQDEWRTTEPLAALDSDDYSSPMSEVVRIADGPRSMPKATQAPQPTMRAVPSTVIPVPTLPSVGSTRGAAIEPVRRSRQPAPLLPMVRPRLAKGTAPLHPNTVERKDLDDTVPGISNDDTLPCIVPGVALAAVASKPAPLRSIKRAQRG